MFIKLVRNEWNKQFKKVPVMIIAILILVLSVVLPITLKYMNDQKERVTHLVETERSLELYREEMNKTIKSEKDRVQAIMFEVEEDYLIMASDLQLSTFDWRNELINEYKTKLTTLKSMEAVKAGMDVDDILKYSYNINLETIESLNDNDEEYLQSQIDLYRSEVNDFYRIITENDYVQGINVYIQWIDEKTDFYQTSILEIEDDPELSDLEKEEDVQSLETMIAMNIANKEVFNYRLCNKIYFNDQDWKSNSLIEVKALNEKLNSNIMSETAFYQYRDNKYKDYEHYLEVQEVLRQRRQDSINTLWYSLEANTPLMEQQYDGRIVTYLTLEIMVMLITLFLIFIGGSIISGEFSRGTIRMLLSRSTGRGQVFLSKVTMLFFVGVGLTFMSGLLAWFISGILYGFEAYSYSYIESVRGIIESKSFFMHVVGEIIPSMGGMIAVIAILVLLSTLTRSTVVTVGSTMALYILAPLLSPVLASYDFIVYTIFPYLNIGAIRLVPDFRNNFWGMGINLNLVAGFWGMVIFTIILLAIAHYVFVKRDIRN